MSLIVFKTSPNLQREMCQIFCQFSHMAGLETDHNGDRVDTAFSSA